MSLPDETGVEESLGEAIARGCGIENLSGYTSLRAHFWSKHRQWGEPYLLLCFSGVGPPLYILVEIKLWSDKSGENEEDQLVRYLNVLDDLPWLDSLDSTTPVEDAVRFLIYLTPRETLSDVRASLGSVPIENQGHARQRLFRLRWQQVGEVARRVAKTAPEPTKTILLDVAQFLHVRGLEPFDGFNRSFDLSDITPKLAHFYSTPAHRFYGWSESAALEDLTLYPSPWNQTPTP